MWTGYVHGKGNRGYGRLMFRGRNIYAHRAMWECANGPIPQGLYVCHHCDNPVCIRPDHLFLGTQKDNMQDARRKGRIAGMGRTHCKAGHPLEQLKRGQRGCPTCMRAYWKERRRR